MALLRDIDVESKRLEEPSGVENLSPLLMVVVEKRRDGACTRARLDASSSPALECQVSFLPLPPPPLPSSLLPLPPVSPELSTRTR